MGLVKPASFNLAFIPGETPLLFMTVLIDPMVASGRRSSWHKDLQPPTVYLFFVILFFLSSKA